MGFDPSMKRAVGADPVEKERVIKIPESEMDISFVRSSGPGGQKVNKTSSKAELHWNVDRSGTFTAEEKEKIKAHLATRMNNLGEVVMSSQTERSQLQNKTNVIERLEALVAEALIPETERIATKPSKGADERRLRSKEKDSRKKADRRWKQNHD